MNAPAATSLTARPAALALGWDDGTSGEFASIWLRDNRPEERDRHSGQRLIDVADLPVEPRIRAAVLAGKQARIT